MRFSVFNISLDIHEADSQAIIIVKKTDTHRRINITLKENGVPYFISPECSAVFTGSKPDGKKLFNSCRIIDNVIQYDLTKQTTVVPGIVKCEIRLYGADNELITSPRFNIIVEDTLYTDGDIIESSPEVEALTSLVTYFNDTKYRIENGEFDGKDGYTPQKGVDYFDGKDGYTPQKGVDYFDGKDGATGPQGPKGDMGPQGPQGPKGNTGATGPQGPQGLKGNTGPQGPQGLKGDTGATGPQGPQGLKGDTGATGPQGPQGPKGDTGNDGADGIGIASITQEYDPICSISWDGNTDDLVANNDIFALPTYKISDLTPTIEELSGSGTITLYDRSTGVRHASPLPRIFELDAPVDYGDYISWLPNVYEFNGFENYPVNAFFAVFIFKEGNTRGIPSGFYVTNGYYDSDVHELNENVVLSDLSFYGLSGEWSEDVPDLDDVAGYWTRLVISYTDGTKIESQPISRTGVNGKTPVKGMDYYTEADKTEMVNRVLKALPTWTGGSY